MSDKMYPMPYEQLLHWVLSEKEKYGTIFGVVPTTCDGANTSVSYQSKQLALAFGPAAGPHTQLAQNIVCAYAAGARYFELKTVQILDGELLQVDKPCIFAKREGYNVEWSTELTVGEAFEEYAKAWFLVHLLSMELYGGSGGGFVFNMSVGYDLEGIRSPKIDGFLESMKDASGTDIWKQMQEVTVRCLDRFEHVSKDDVMRISPHISDSVTLSTLHGCPASDIENIATHLMCTKGLHTCVKCNPMLLGYDFVRTALDTAGYDYLELDENVFAADLNFDQAVDMIKRLEAAAAGYCTEFGIKLTNTLPVKSYGNLLPGESFYVSGSALYPLTINVTARLGEALGGTVHMSYSGGADESNIADILGAGIYPVTVSTRLLKPGGYKNLTKLASLLQDVTPGPLDSERLRELAEKSLEKPVKAPVRSARIEASGESLDEIRRTCYICNNCVDVCPNRANIGFSVDGVKAALHMDALCNECGNCADFCPKGYVPYKDKLTIFDAAEHMKGSGNEGVAVLDWDKRLCLVRINEKTAETAEGSITGEARLDELLETVLDAHPYLFETKIRAVGKD